MMPIAIRKIFGLRPSPEFLQWLERTGIYRNGEYAAARCGATGKNSCAG